MACGQPVASGFAHFTPQWQDWYHSTICSKAWDSAFFDYFDPPPLCCLAHFPLPEDSPRRCGIILIIYLRLGLEDYDRATSSRIIYIFPPSPLTTNAPELKKKKNRKKGLSPQVSIPVSKDTNPDATYIAAMLRIFGLRRCKWVFLSFNDTSDTRKGGETMGGVGRRSVTSKLQSTFEKGSSRLSFSHRS